MVDLGQPPWAVAADESRRPGGVEFAPCENVVAQLVAKMGAKLGQATYTASGRWGLVLRTTLLMSGGGSSEPRVTCWGQPGGKVNIVVDFSGLEPPPG